MEILKVFKHSVVYGLTGVASTFAAVLLLPIYTRILTPEDYGVIAILRTLVGILVIVFNLGMGSAIFWAYYRAENEEEKKKVVGTALLFQFLLPLILTLLLIVASPFFNKLIFQGDQPLFYLTIVFMTIFFQAGIVIPLAVLRAKEQPRRYVLLTLSNLILTIFFSVLLVVFLRLGVLGVLLGSFIGNFLVYLASLPFVIRYAKLGISLSWLKDMLSFGVPMVPAGLSMWILNSSDRYFLNYFRDLSEVGIYNVGYRVGTLIILVVGAVQLAYAPFIFSVQKKENAKKLYRRFATYYLLIIFFLGLVISVLSKEVITILIGPKFHASFVIVPFIAFSYVAFGLYNIFATGISLKKKTIYALVSTILASLANLGFNFLLIPKFGMVGAGIATILSFSILMVLMYNFSNRVYPINYELGRMAKIIVVGIIIYGVALQINISLWFTTLFKSFLLLTYLPLLYLFGFFHENERKRLVYLLKSIKHLKENPKQALTMMKGPFQ